MIKKDDPFMSRYAQIDIRGFVRDISCTYKDEKPESINIKLWDGSGPVSEPYILWCDAGCFHAGHAFESDYHPHGLTFEQLCDPKFLQPGYSVTVFGSVVPPSLFPDSSFSSGREDVSFGISFTMHGLIVDSTEKSRPASQLSLKAQSLAELYRLYEKSPELIRDVRTKFYGWIRRSRGGGAGTMVFVDLYDGTKVGELKCLAPKDQYLGSEYESKVGMFETEDELTDSKSFKTLEYDQLLKSEHLSDGCAVVVDGKIVLSPSTATQKFEMMIQRLRVIGEVADPLTYPIQKTTEKSLIALRRDPVMRVRSQISQSIFKIVSDLEFGTDLFMKKRRIVNVRPSLVTSSDCEGGSDTFTITPNIFASDPEKAPAIKAVVSSQLPLEFGICGFKEVYTKQQSFRAENSDTLKHLAEFLHLEYEAAFTTLDKLLTFTETLIKFLIDYIYAECPEEFAFIESKLAPTEIKSSKPMLSDLIKRPFHRIKHKDAVALIQRIVAEKMQLPDDDGVMKRVKVDKMPAPDADLGSEHEKLLVRYFGFTQYSEEERSIKLAKKEEFGAFVFVTHWPSKIKSFYMKKSDDPAVCESYDLLSPRFGEIVGGSMREDSYTKLMDEVTSRGMDVRPLQWFIDLRKTGSMPHGGFGLGFARLCALITGVPSVRDCVYMPVYAGHQPF
jgi:asparaginyl-tRNA synthetase